MGDIAKKTIKTGGLLAGVALTTIVAIRAGAPTVQESLRPSAVRGTGAGSHVDSVMFDRGLDMPSGARCTVSGDIAACTLMDGRMLDCSFDSDGQHWGCGLAKERL